MTCKTRVIADMPSTPKRPNARLVQGIVLAFITFFLGIYAGEIIVERRKLNKNEAVPMAGDCIDMPLRRYVGGDRDSNGSGDKDSKICDWHNQMYQCVYDPNKDQWSCDMVSRIPVPTEKK